MKTTRRRNLVAEALREVRDALKDLTSEVTSLRGEVKGLRAALVERENDFARQHRVVKDEMARHDRLIINLQQRMPARAGR